MSSLHRDTVCPWRMVYARATKNRARRKAKVLSRERITRRWRSRHWSWCDHAGVRHVHGGKWTRLIATNQICWGFTLSTVHPRTGRPHPPQKYPSAYCIGAVTKIKTIAKIKGVTIKRNIDRRIPFTGTASLGLSFLDENRIFPLTEMSETIILYLFWSRDFWWCHWVHFVNTQIICHPLP